MIMQIPSKTIRTRDLGEVAFLRCLGLRHKAMCVNGDREVEFLFNGNASEKIMSYWQGGLVEAQKFKSELDAVKSLIFNELRRVDYENRG